MIRPVTKLFIVTPSFNTADHIERTLMNIASQAGAIEIHHHVQDAASDDGTTDILARWAQVNAYDVLPQVNAGYRFSWDSAPDEGMYDAIAKGFARCDASAMDWLTWLNADDLLMPGAAAHLAELDIHEDLSEVSWVAGLAALMVNDTLRVITEKKFTRAALAGGLCDGRWWDFLQAEGTFFRRRLWDQIDPQADFARFKLAGDWNLWRLFAAHDELYQLTVPTGVFVQREGQLSADLRDAYLAEIDAVAGTARRRTILRQLAAGDPPRKILKHDFKARRLRRETASAKEFAKFWVQKTDGKHPADDDGASARVVAHDADWQFPAITEQHAFQRVQDSLIAAPGMTYFAFPWATLIDRLNNWADDRDELLLALREKSVELLGADRIFTVCQHIHLERLAPYMREAGVTDVFWTHAVRGQTVLEGDPPIRIHPFPLYPVQLPALSDAFESTDREHLFSFVGARANEWYLTEVRNWILDEMGGDPRGFVRGRDTWFYNDVVYEHQIRRKTGVDAPLVDQDAGEQFRRLLTSSVFSLCPSGSGPNSIRLWESIAAGAIPVVLADSWAPPGDEALWREAVVFCKETPAAVRTLPDQLETMARDATLLANKKAALRQLWALYGPQSFITDIQSAAMASASLTYASQTSANRRKAGPRPRMKVHLFGRHAIRTPLGTDSYRAYFADDMALVDTPNEADLLVVGFDLDLREAGSDINAMLAANKKLRLVVLSEEPLWDTIWSLNFAKRNAWITLAGETHPVTVLNHFTSDIYCFEALPYYVTTRNAFFNRYADRFTRLSAQSAGETLTRWRETELRTAFFAERRTDERYSRAFPEHGVEGLCVYRTRVAEAVNEARTLRVGMGWDGGTDRRKLPDWHLDKLARLDRRARVISGVENTHLRHYITEKVFDAFAFGAMPLYYAGPNHRIFDFVSPESIINLHGHDPDAAAQLVQAFEPGREAAEAHLDAQARLAERFNDPAILFRERRRVADAVIRELRRVAEKR